MRLTQIKIRKYSGYVYDLSMKNDHNFFANGICVHNCQKKKYVTDITYDEGVFLTEPKIKVTGLEAIRTNTPAYARDYIKKAFKIMCEGKEEELQTLIAKCRTDFFKQPFSVVARPTGVNGITENTDFRGMYKKGTHINAKAAIIYNFNIKKHDLDKKYRMIGEGDKIKYVYLKTPNPVKEVVFASPEDEMPKELDLDKYIDYETQFNKTIETPIQNVLNVFGWTLEPKNSLAAFFS